MKILLLAAILAAAPAAAQTRLRVPVSGLYAVPGLGASFDGARVGATPMLMPTLSPDMRMPALDRLFDNSASASPEALAVPVMPAAPVHTDDAREFSQAPAWFDASQLKFGALIHGAAGGTAILRYGWRSQYEMAVFAYPASPSILFKEHALNPMAPAKQSFEAALATPAARKAAAKILRAVLAKDPVSGKDKAVLDEVLAFLDGEDTLSLARGVVPPTSYTWRDRPIKNGVMFSGEGLPTVAVVRENSDIRAAINGMPVTLGFTGSPDAPPSVMVLQGSGETLTVDLESARPKFTGELSGERLSAAQDDSALIIRYGENRFHISQGDVLSLTGLQPGDVPEPVRRFAAYLLIVRAIL